MPAEKPGEDSFLKYLLSLFCIFLLFKKLFELSLTQCSLIKPLIFLLHYHLVNALKYKLWLPAFTK